MRYRSAALLLGAILGLLPLLASAQTSLWRVSDGRHSLLIGGTVHALGEADYPLPAAFDRAYAEAARLVFETDMAAIEDPAFQRDMAERLSYGEGRQLRDDLRAETYRELQAWCEAHGIPMSLVDHLRPPMVSLVVMMDELQRLGIAGQGVEEYFYRRAQADGKALSALETPRQQLAFIASMGCGQEDALIRNSLRDARDAAGMMGRLKAAWRAGDAAALARLGIAPLRREHPGLYRELLVRRNQAWLGSLRAFLDTPETELVLVGALHLVGEDGLLALLRRHGYRVEAY